MKRISKIPLSLALLLFVIGCSGPHVVEKATQDLRQGDALNRELMAILSETLDQHGFRGDRIESASVELVHADGNIVVNGWYEPDAFNKSMIVGCFENSAIKWVKIGNEQIVDSTSDSR